VRAFSKFLACSTRQQGLLVAACGYVLAARLALRLRSLPAVQQSTERLPQHNAARHSSEQIAWAVAAAARHLGASNCLVEAVACHALLRRNRYGSRLCIGVRSAAPLEAHAWIELNDVRVIGDFAPPEFVPLRPPAR